MSVCIEIMKVLNLHVVVINIVNSRELYRLNYNGPHRCHYIHTEFYKTGSLFSELIKRQQTQPVFDEII
jgi:hypothetical protein